MGRSLKLKRKDLRTAVAASLMLDVLGRSNPLERLGAFLSERKTKGMRKEVSLGCGDAARASFQVSERFGKAVLLKARALMERIFGTCEITMDRNTPLRVKGFLKATRRTFLTVALSLLASPVFAGTVLPVDITDYVMTERYQGNLPACQFYATVNAMEYLGGLPFDEGDPIALYETVLRGDGEVLSEALDNRAAVPQKVLELFALEEFFDVRTVKARDLGQRFLQKEDLVDLIREGHVLLAGISRYDFNLYGQIHSESSVEDTYIDFSLEEIRESLKEYSPVTSELNGETVTEGHAVTVFGFHEDPSMPGGGAFLVKNSHEGFGYKGVAMVSVPLLMSTLDHREVTVMGLEKVEEEATAQEWGR